MNFYQFFQILNEYGQKKIDQLIEKFQKEKPGLSREIISAYINDFEKISKKLTNKDIDKYSWKELETTIDSNRPKPKIKAGKLDPTVTDANLIYNQNNIRVYLGKDKKSCIRYGNGYTFCISARGSRSMYGSYRIEDRGTPYFIFNDNLSKEDNRHILVIFKYPKDNMQGQYSVTLADNTGEDYYRHFVDISTKYPWVQPLRKLIKDVEPDVVEFIEHHLTNEYNHYKQHILNNFKIINKKISPYLKLSLRNLLHNEEIYEFINNNKKIVNVNIYEITNNNLVYGEECPHMEKIRSLQTNLTIIEETFLLFKNESDILKEIKSAIKTDVQQILTTATECSELIFINKIFFELDKQKDKLKSILDNDQDSFAPEFENIEQMVLNELDDQILVLPYFIVTFGFPQETVRSELRNNIYIIDILKKIEQNYIKQINWIKTAPVDKLNKIKTTDDGDEWHTPRLDMDYSEPISNRVKKVMES